MSKNNENNLVQNLRFPGFSKSWVVKPVSEICEVFRGSPLSKADLDENGSEPCIHYGELFTKYAEVISSIYSKTNRKNGFKSEVGDVLMPSSDVTPDGLAKASAIMLNDVILGEDMNILRPFKDINPIFLSYLLNRSKRDIIKLVSGTTVKHIYPSQISTCPLLIVNDTSEQQKIAACLSSLDEVITAESQKLEVLKDHKRGLLQILLPQAGETVPKFRFKEFEDSGDWVFDTFSEYIKLYRGSSPRPIQNYFTTDDIGVNWIKIGDTKNADNFIIKQVEERITPEGAEKSRKVNVGELILANSMSFGKTYQLAIEGYIYDGWFVLREYEQFFDKQFLLQLLNSDYMQTQYKKLSAGGIVQNISSDIVYKTILPHTSINEQKQIAASLTSLDEIISAQSKKVEALQLHKKGLLQGLFPNVNEVTE